MQENAASQKPREDSLLKRRFVWTKLSLAKDLPRSLARMVKISETIVETNLPGGALTLTDVAFKCNGSSPRRIGTLSIGCRELADARIAF